MKVTNLQPATKQVVVLGARGRLGWAVVQAFAKAGWQVVAQMRPGATPHAAWPGVTWHACSMADIQHLAVAVPGARVVVHAMNPSQYTESAWAQEAPAMTAAAVDLAERLGALLLFPGNVYGFGAQMPPVLMPAAAQQPSHGMGRIRCGLESQLATASKRGLNVAIIRAGDFFGAGQGTWLDRVMAKDLGKGRFTYPGGLDVPHAWAYLPDLAEVFVRVAQAWGPHAGGRIEMLHFAGHTLTGREWLTALEAHGGKRLDVGALPWWAMRLLALVKPEMATLVAMRYLWDCPHALDHHSLQALIGPEPHTPFAEALSRVLAR